MRWTLSIVLCVISLPVLASAWVNVTVSTPANNSTVTSPVLIAASATSDRNITGWRIYVDGTSVYHTGSTKSIRTSVTMAPGTHQVLIRAWASNGTNGSVTLTETVGSSTPGTAQGTVTPTSLAFGSVATNTSSSSQAVKITNTGSATLNISGVSISPSQFAVSGPTSTSIAPGSSAAYSVTFSPTAVSAYSGNDVLQHELSDRSSCSHSERHGCEPDPDSDSDPISDPISDPDRNELLGNGILRVEFRKR